MKKLLMVDSRDRDYANYVDPNNYRVVLPAVYKRVHAVRLRSIEVPNSFFSFSASRKNVSLRVNKGHWSTITIPDGNYVLENSPTSNPVQNSLMLALQTALNDEYGANTFTVTVNPVNYLISISCTSAFSIDTSYDARPSSSFYGLGYNLGLKKGVLQSDANNTITSTYVPQINPDNYIVMELDLLNSVDELAWEGNSTAAANAAFSKISINNNPGSYMIQNDTNSVLGETRLWPPREKLTNLQVRFRFHDGSDVNFNKVDHSFLLEIEHEV